jgi:PKHD-type hydroxylase
MFIRIPGLLDTADLRACRATLAHAQWVDGNLTSGTQAAQAKNNRQLPEDAPGLDELRLRLLRRLHVSPLFQAAALPRRIYPPLFNRYEGAANAFGKHIDNAIRVLPDGSAQLRTDLSCTVFLSEPNDYDGGELVVETGTATQRIKLPAGDGILYSATTVHRVEPVTRGARLASFFWIESLVREDSRRALLFEMDLAIMTLRQEHGDEEPIVKLTGCYHNLLRQWATP